MSIVAYQSNISGPVCLSRAVQQKHERPASSNFQGLGLEDRGACRDGCHKTVRQRSSQKRGEVLLPHYARGVAVRVDRHLNCGTRTEKEHWGGYPGLPDVSTRLPREGCTRAACRRPGLLPC